MIRRIDDFFMTLPRRSILVRAAFLAVAGLLLLCGQGRADLAVSIPPGTPLDWSLWRVAPSALSEIPSLHIPGESKDETQAPVDPRISGVDPERQMERMTDTVVDVARFGEAVDPWAESSITTVDVGTHLPWVRVVGFDDKGAPVSAPVTYKPQVDEALRMRVLGVFVQLYLHRRARVSIMEAVSHLTQIGQPVYFAAKDVKDDCAELKDTARFLLDAVGEPAGRPSRLRKERNESDESFAFRKLIQEELSGGYAFGYDRTFGRNLIELGNDIVPWLADAALKHENSLVRRNAAALLESFEDPKAVAALRSLLKSGDPVCRRRATMALARRKDFASVPALLAALKDMNDYYYQFDAAYALGVIGDPEAEAALVKWGASYVGSGQSDGSTDVCWVLLPALLRLHAKSDDARALYTQARDKWQNGTPIWQLASLGLAGLGDKRAVEDLNKRIEKRGLLALEAGVLGAAVDFLAAQPDALGSDLLRPLVSRGDFPMQYRALKALKVTRDDAPMLASLAKNAGTHKAVAALALLRLWQVDADAGQKVAASIQQRFLNASPVASNFSDDAVLAFAIRLRAATGTLDAKAADALLKHAVDFESENGFTPWKTDVKGLPAVGAPVLETCLYAAARCGSPASAEYMMDALSNGRPAVRLHAAKALGALGNDAVAERMLLYLSDDDPWVRLFIARAFRSMSGGEDDEFDWFYAKKEKLHEGVHFWTQWLKKSTGEE